MSAFHLLAQARPHDVVHLTSLIPFVLGVYKSLNLGCIIIVDFKVAGYRSRLNCARIIREYLTTAALSIYMYTYIYIYVYIYLYIYLVRPPHVITYSTRAHSMVVSFPDLQTSLVPNPTLERS